MKFNLYIFNHGKHDGVEDYLSIFKDVLVRRGHELAVSEYLDPYCINIIIDEFTNVICNQAIATFKKQHPHSQLVFVLTEFIERRLLVRSLNFFGGLMEAATIAALNVFIRLRRRDLLPPSFSDWIIATLYSPLLAIYYLLHQLKNWYSKNPVTLLTRLHMRAYLSLRYLGLEKMIGYADAVILSHPMIEPGLRTISSSVPVLGTLYPEIDFNRLKKTLFRGKQLLIEITGSITPYRKKYIDKIDFYLLELGISHIFHLSRAISWNTSKSGTVSFRDHIERRSPSSAKSAVGKKRMAYRGAFSLHPPQNSRWRYSSPTRIYRALRYDHNLPVLTKLFDQHPIERLCLVFERKETLIQMYRYFKDPVTLFAYLKPRVREYMCVATQSNDAIVAAMVAMSDKGIDVSSRPK